MRKAYLVSAFLLCFVLAGCNDLRDNLRRLAGRPDSEAIAAKRAIIEEEERLERERADSLKAAADSVRAAEKAAADSLALLDTIRQSRTMMLPLSSLRRADVRNIDKRYYAVIGAFSVMDNARRQASRAEKAGYPAFCVKYGHDRWAVLSCGADRLAQIWDSVNRIRKESFCKNQAWILVNE